LKHIENSIFQDYLLTLPLNKSYPYLYYDDEILEIIDGDYDLAHDIHERRRYLARAYTEFLKVNAKVFDAEQSASFWGDPAGISPADYIFARYIVEMAGWNLGGKRVLLPLDHMIPLKTIQKPWQVRSQLLT
jgi:hypothetical protein